MYFITEDCNVDCFCPVPQIGITEGTLACEELPDTRTLSQSNDVYMRFNCECGDKMDRSRIKLMAPTDGSEDHVIKLKILGPSKSRIKWLVCAHYKPAGESPCQTPANNTTKKNGTYKVQLYFRDADNPIDRSANAGQYCPATTLTDDTGATIWNISIKRYSED